MKLEFEEDKAAITCGAKYQRVGSILRKSYRNMHMVPFHNELHAKILKHNVKLCKTKQRRTGSLSYTLPTTRLWLGDV